MLSRSAICMLYCWRLRLIQLIYIKICERSRRCPLAGSRSGSSQDIAALLSLSISPLLLPFCPFCNGCSARLGTKRWRRSFGRLMSLASPPADSGRSSCKAERSCKQGLRACSVTGTVETSQKSNQAGTGLACICKWTSAAGRKVG